MFTSVFDCVLCFKNEVISSFASYGNAFKKEYLKGDVRLSPTAHAKGYPYAKWVICSAFAYLKSSPTEDAFSESILRSICPGRQKKVISLLEPIVEADAVVGP